MAKRQGQSPHEHPIPVQNVIYQERLEEFPNIWPNNKNFDLGQN